MANRNFASQKLFSFHAMPVELDCKFDIGASGAVSNLKGPGIASVTRLSAGRYQIKLQDNYNKLYACIPQVKSPVSGSAIDPQAASIGTVYEITLVGNTDWATAGLPAGFTPAVGMILKLAANPAVGTGRVKAVGASGIASIEIMGSIGGMLSPLSNPQSSVQGGLITIQCLAATSSSDTTLIPADPADGSALAVMMLLSNSSVVLQGE